MDFFQAKSGEGGNDRDLLEVISDFVATSSIPEPTAKRILPALREAGILRVLVEASGRRAATLCFPALLNIAEGQEAF